MRKISYHVTCCACGTKRTDTVNENRYIIPTCRECGSDAVAIVHEYLNERG